MDESFLSDKDVIEASRNFVCIRLATYENEGEAEFLKTVYVNRSGDLENTVFVILSPDTKKNLCRAGRGPNFAYRSPKQMASAMNKIAKNYPEADADNSSPSLPQMKNIRLGLNVASCDGLPLIICVSQDEATLNSMQATLAGLAFETELAGKYGYASTADTNELSMISDFKNETGYFIVQPSEYGLQGRVVKQLATDTSVDDLRSAMVEYLETAPITNKSHHDHVRTGNRKGKSWETELPVTDPHSRKAMERNKRGRGRR